MAPKDIALVVVYKIFAVGTNVLKDKADHAGPRPRLGAPVLKLRVYIKSVDVMVTKE